MNYHHEMSNKKFKLIETYFDNIDTQEKAYILGFLYADGYNGQKYNTIKICLATKDLDILNKIDSILYVDNLSHVKFYKNKKRDECYINFNSKYMCEQLAKLGCIQAKSLILEFPSSLIDNELQRHFIRGYYDGDGGLTISKKKTRGAKISITSTLSFISSLKKIIEKNINIHFSTTKQSNVYTISSCGNQQIQRFLDWLYKDCIICLNRKYNKYIDLVNKNKQTQILIKNNTKGYSKRYLIS
jgi:hypothetical protein